MIATVKRLFPRKEIKEKKTKKNYICLKGKRIEDFISAVRNLDCNVFNVIKETKMNELELFCITEEYIAKEMNI